MKYIVDIDGTICRTTGGDYTRSQPFPERIQKINDLYNSGHHITYWTARGGNSGIDWTDVTKEQLTRWGCLYHELRMRKPVYDVWIDDRAVWSEDYFK